MRPALVIGSRMPGLAVIRSLGSIGVPVVVLRYHAEDFGYGSRWAGRRVDCPHPERDTPGFLAVLDRLADRYPGALLVPPSDIAVSVVAEHVDAVRALGYLVAAPDVRAVRICLDKSATHQFALVHGIPAPATVTLRDGSDLRRFATDHGFPAVLKPAVSHRYQAVFHRKWTRVDDLTMAIKHYDAASAAGFEMVVQELIGGDELCGANYNAYRTEDGHTVETTASKIRNSPAETGSPCVVVSRELPEVAEAGRRMLSALDYRGFANIEFKRDPRDDRYKLIEVNARHNLSSMLAIRCGVDFPALEYRHRVLGQRPTQPVPTQGVHWIDITRDLRAARGYLSRPDYSTARFVRPYLSRPVFAVASLRDPRPAAIRGLHTLAAVGARVRTLGRHRPSVAAAEQPASQP